MEKCSVTLCFLCFAHLDWAQAKQSEHAGENQREPEREREGSSEASSPNNQYLTSSQRFCWLKGNMKRIWSACSPVIPLSSASYGLFLQTNFAFMSYYLPTFFFPDIYLSLPSCLHPNFIILENNSISVISQWQENNQREGERRKRLLLSWHPLAGFLCLSLVGITLNRHTHTHTHTHTHRRGNDLRLRTANIMREMRRAALWAQRDSVVCQRGGQTGGKGRTRLPPGPRHNNP